MQTFSRILKPTILKGNFIQDGQGKIQRMLIMFELIIFRSMFNNVFDVMFFNSFGLRETLDKFTCTLNDLGLCSKFLLAYVLIFFYNFVQRPYDLKRKASSLI